MANEYNHAWLFLCNRLQRDPQATEETDTISMRSAVRAIIAYADKPSLEVQIRLEEGK